MGDVSPRLFAKRQTGGERGKANGRADREIGDPGGDREIGGPGGEREIGGPGGILGIWRELLG
jgi:hypothetical protein